VRLYARFLIFLCCTRGWVRTIFAFNKALKIAKPCDTITLTTTLNVILPEEGINLKVKKAEENLVITPASGRNRRLN